MATLELKTQPNKQSFRLSRSPTSFSTFFSNLTLTENSFETIQIDASPEESEVFEEQPGVNVMKLSSQADKLERLSFCETFRSV